MIYKRKRVFSGSVLGILLVMATASVPGYFIIWPGTTVCNIDLGGITPAKAEMYLKEKLLWEERKLVLVGQDATKKVVPFEVLGLNPDIKNTVSALRRPLWDAFLRKEFPLVISVDQSKLESWLRETITDFNVPAKNATFIINEKDQVVVKPGRLGWVLDKEKFMKILLRDKKWFYVPDFIDLPFVQVKPRVTKEELESFLPLEVISSYTTSYQDKNDRAYNIFLAGKALDGVTVRPGEVLSFNNITGPRTKERGYRKAPVFVGNDVVDDYGGGVCQLSTTLYVALLGAGFEVVERHNHGMPVSYVPLGFDATVVFDLLDLKMKNAGTWPCVIKVEVNQGFCTVKVFGRKDEGIVIEVGSRIIEEIPAKEESIAQVALEDNSQNAKSRKNLRNGFLVETFRKYIKDGRVIKIEKLNISWYPPEKPNPSSGEKNIT